MKGILRFMANPYPWLIATVVVFLSTLTLGITTWAFAENTISSLQETVVLFDPAAIPILTWEADLTPTITVERPGQPRMVVRGWGWGYDYAVSFPDRPTLVQPFGAKYENGTITGRAWTQWGIPGDITTWNVATTVPPEDPFVVAKIFANGQKLYSQNLLPGVIPIYNLEGETVIRALIWVWRNGETVRLRTWQVAVGQLVPAGGAYSRRPLPPLPEHREQAVQDPIVVEPRLVYHQLPPRDVCVTIDDVFLFTGGSFTTTDDWRTTVWRSYAWVGRTPAGEPRIFETTFNIWEANPLITGRDYLKFADGIWDPTRLIGSKLCPKLDSPIPGWKIF